MTSLIRPVQYMLTSSMEKNGLHARAHALLFAISSCCCCCRFSYCNMFPISVEVYAIYRVVHNHTLFNKSKRNAMKEPPCPLPKCLYSRASKVCIYEVQYIWESVWVCMSVVCVWYSPRKPKKNKHEQMLFYCFTICFTSHNSSSS